MSRSIRERQMRFRGIGERLRKAWRFLSLAGHRRVFAYHRGLNPHHSVFVRVNGEKLDMEVIPVDWAPGSSPTVVIR
jgi:hypothetical protein